MADLPLKALSGNANRNTDRARMGGNIPAEPLGEVPGIEIRSTG